MQEEIVNVEEEDPDCEPYEVIERCFGEQNRGNLTCFGAGIRPKHVRGPLSSRSSLNEQLQASQRDNNNLRHLMEEMAKKFEAEREQDRAKRQEMERKQEEMERNVRMLMATLGKQ